GRNRRRQARHGHGQHQGAQLGPEMSANCLVVIPSRYGSTRFPGKVLAELDGKPIVQWCYEAAKAARVGPVVVATEDERVAGVVRAFGGEVQLTSAACQSGSDRVFEAAK